MRCPHCGSLDDKVLDSRTLASGDAIRRRRQCNECGIKFTSYERIDMKPLLVVKRDGRREPFDREKSERGVQRALEKWPVAAMELERLVNEVEDEAALKAGLTREVEAAWVGDTVLAKIGALDMVAYVRFASVYKRFETLDEFVNEIWRLNYPQSGAPDGAAPGGA
jgi:transcriptional repressor NrdR